MPKKSQEKVLQEVQAGLTDFRMDNLRISKHALKRMQERRIPIEDLRRNKPKIGKVIKVGNTVVTTYRKPNEDTVVFNESKQQVFLSKVCCKNQKLVGQIIGKNGSNIKKIQSIIQSSRITYDRKHANFHIETLSANGSSFLKKFLTNYLVLLNETGNRPHFATINVGAVDSQYLKKLGIELFIFEDMVVVMNYSKKKISLILERLNSWQLTSSNSNK